ncbi:hypothetical protein B5M42_019960 [Paenibacillus athensensis]|uniref:Uncharacterized protein n=1 Tax=Paenibacillus athensensis TaxID=1967502 RepID=A0A4Y8Q2F5_9BACL|nr:hypothetical protein [Paenibacillus athensensis]MCD1261083.1 hypothetical protein [Paenibacillus athensensis]
MTDGNTAATEGCILVSAPNQAGKAFLSLLRERGLDFYAMTNSNYGKRRLEAMGVDTDTIIQVNTTDAKTWNPPEVPIREVYLFELSFTLCCRYVQICRSWNPAFIHVITKKSNSRIAYRGLGVDRLTFIENNDVSFLLPERCAAASL